MAACGLGVEIPQNRYLGSEKRHPNLYPPCQACNCGHAYDGIHDESPGPTRAEINDVAMPF